MAAKSDLRVNVSGDTTGLERAFNRASRSLDQFGKRTTLFGRVTSRGFSQVGVAATGMAAAFGGVALAAKSAVEGASDISESLAKNTVLFGENAKTVDAFSKTTASAFGISRKAALEATGTFGNLFTALGIGQGESAKMSVELTKLAADLASFNNATPDEALEAIRSGLVGETEPLRRFGVNLNDATLRAEALRMGIVKTTKDALEPQAKALAVNSLIFRQTATAQGDFARTSDGLANQQRILKATFTDVKDSVGTALLPSFTAAVSYINREVAPAFKNLATDLNGIFDRKDIDLGEKLKLSGAAVKRNLGPVVAEIRSAIGEMELGDKLGDAFTRAVPALMNAAAKAAPKVALAFVRGWAGAGAWGQLLTAGFIAGKLGAFKGAGSTAAASFMASFVGGGKGGKGGKGGGVNESSGDAAGRRFGGGIGMGIAAGLAATAPSIAKAGDDALEPLEKRIEDWLGKSEAGRVFKNVIGWWPGQDRLPWEDPKSKKGAPGGPSVNLGSVLGPIKKGLGLKGDTAGLTATAQRGAQAIAGTFGPAIKITSGHRTAAENRAVGGAGKSDHLTGNALDLVPIGGWNKKSIALFDRIAAWAKRNPAVRWVGWRGEPGHGPGDHLHISFKPGANPSLDGAPSVGQQVGIPTGGGSNIPSAYIEAINRYGPKVAGIAKGYGISGEALLAKLLKGESGFRMDAVSSAGARGAAQFMPGSRRIAMEKFGVDPWASPDQAVQGAVLHLLGKINGSKGLRGYNPGDPNYTKYILGQKVGSIEDVDSFGTPERLSAEDFVRIALNAIIKPVRSRYGPLISKRGRAIAGLDTSFEGIDRDLSRTETTNALTDEDLSTQSGRDRRVSEIKAVLGFKNKRKANREKKLRELKALIATYKKMGQDINRRLKSKRTSKHLRPALRKEYERIMDRVEGYVAEAATLGEDIADFALDIEETTTELEGAQIGEYRGADDDGADDEFARVERGFGQSREDLDTPEGRATRTNELNVLKGLKQKQISGKQARARALETAIKKWEGRIATARKQLSGKNAVKGAAAARVRARVDAMEERVIDMKTELAGLTGQIQDLQFDVGDLDLEIQDVNDPGAGRSSYDKLADDLSLIDDQERAGDYTPQQAREARRAQINAALGGAYGPINDRERLKLRGDLAELDRNTIAVDENTSAIQQLRDEVKRQNDIATSTLGIQTREIARALTDMVSGQLGMNGLGRQSLPGAGVPALR